MMIGKGGAQDRGSSNIYKGRVYLMWPKLYSNSRVHFI